MGKMIKKVLILRHGKTEANIEKRYIGSRTDIPLSAEGVNGVEAASSYIRQEAGDNIFLVSSPLKRAVQTAELLFPGEEILLKDDLKEIDFGDFEGKNYQELKDNPDYQKWIDSNGTMPFPNGEDRAGIIERSVAAFETVLAEAGEKTPVIICHGGIVMGIMSSLTGKEYYDFMIGNMEGFLLSVSLENERIIDISYNSINP
jgi:alpha-ribazole phosphatase